MAAIIEARSLLDGLSLTRGDGRIEVLYPRALRELAHARDVARAHGLEVGEGPAGAWRLEARAAEPYPAALKAFFAQLNDLRAPPTGMPRRAVQQPLVSCIVVVNENLPFVEQQFLPSLLACSVAHPIEVVLVCNGNRDAPPEAPGVAVLRSEWGAVAKAYNAGAARARGEFLAIFHDDCILYDARWIEKCLQRLERGAHAVAGEYRQIAEIGGVAVPPLPVAKCVPLVLRRADFVEAGGFDEQHYIGYEDLDFTLALASRGKKLVATDLDLVHFHGMSSTLKYHPVPGLADLYAFAAVPAFAVARRFNEFWRTGLVADGVNYLRAAMDAQLLYVLQKYRAFLGRSGNDAYARAEAALAGGPQDALRRLRALDAEAARRVAP
ncbi:MAG TPA: glycosyltransferase family A protein [Burkholderiales bacterium]